jgi:hypothetical protein
MRRSVSFRRAEKRRVRAENNGPAIPQERERIWTETETEGS